MSRRAARQRTLRQAFHRFSSASLVLLLLLTACQEGEAFRIPPLRPLLSKKGLNSTVSHGQQKSKSHHQKQPSLVEPASVELAAPEKKRIPVMVGDMVIWKDEEPAMEASADTSIAHGQHKSVGMSQNRTGNELGDKHARSHRRSHSEVHDRSPPGEKPRPERSGHLDIVLTHYDPARLHQMISYWTDFLQLEMVQQMKPYVYLYCQNENMGHEADMKPLLQHGGEMVHLENVGRESHAFLQHITGHYNDLANHTIFAQDISSEELPARFQGLFDNRTGYLPLSLVGHVDCADPWLPAGTIPQIYAMFASQLCPPEGYTAGFEGQFVVSKKRILKHGWWTYRHLLDLLAADESHWIHGMHNNNAYKDKTNPMFGHVIERAWSVAFDCFESWRMNNCYMCIWGGMQDCGTDACQCYDQ